VLNSIEQYNLVRSQTASRPKKYVAVEPSTALDRLLEDKKRELDEKADQYESIVDDLADELDAAEPVEEQFWTAAVGPEETIDLLLERLCGCRPQYHRNGVVIPLPGDMQAVSEEINVNRRPRSGRLGRSVDDPRDGRFDVGGSGPAVSGDLAATRRLLTSERTTTSRARSTSSMGSRSVFRCPIRSPGEAFGMIDLKDPEFAANVHEEFVPRWSDAEPLEF